MIEIIEKLTIGRELVESTLFVPDFAVVPKHVLEPGPVL